MDKCWNVFMPRESAKRFLRFQETRRRPAHDHVHVAIVGYLRAYDSVNAARADIADYFDWYNTHRPHSKLERLTPQEKYVATLPKQRLAA